MLAYLSRYTHRVAIANSRLITDPFDLAQRREIRRECLNAGERDVFAKELETAGLVRGE